MAENLSNADVYDLAAKTLAQSATRLLQFSEIVDGNSRKTSEDETNKAEAVAFAIRKLQSAGQAYAKSSSGLAVVKQIKAANTAIESATVSLTKAAFHELKSFPSSAISPEVEGILHNLLSHLIQNLSYFLQEPYFECAATSFRELFLSKLFLHQGFPRLDVASQFDSALDQHAQSLERSAQNMEGHAKQQAFELAGRLRRGPMSFMDQDYETGRLYQYALESKFPFERETPAPVSFVAPAGRETDVASDANVQLQQYLKSRGVPSELWPEAASAITEIVDIVLEPQKKPVRELSAKEVKELIAHGRKKSNQYENRADDDKRDIFEFIRDTYARWYPGILMENLKSADKKAWQNLAARRSRAKKGEAEIPEWFDVPTKAENEFRSASPIERIRMEAFRSFWKKSNRQRRSGPNK
jgi:hypothetical protein